MEQLLPRRSTPSCCCLAPDLFDGLPESNREHCADRRQAGAPNDDIAVAAPPAQPHLATAATQPASTSLADEPSGPSEDSDDFVDLIFDYADEDKEEDLAPVLELSGDNYNLMDAALEGYVLRSRMPVEKTEDEDLKA